MHTCCGAEQGIPKRLQQLFIEFDSALDASCCSSRYCVIIYASQVTSQQQLERHEVHETIVENANESVEISDIHKFDQQTLVTLLAKRKGLLFRSSENEAPFSVNDFGVPICQRYSSAIHGTAQATWSEVYASSTARR